MRNRAPLLLAAFVAARAAQLLLLGPGLGNDVPQYARYGCAWLEGKRPYIDFAIEYPPGAMLLFVLPAALPSYRVFFVAEMMLFDLLGFLVTWRLAVRLAAGDASRSGLVACALYLAGGALLAPLLYARFDLAPATLAGGALLGVAARRHVAVASPLLGAATAFKLWPLFLLPLVLRGAGRRWPWAASAFLLGALLVSLPALVSSGFAVARFLAPLDARGIGVESTWASLGFLLGCAGGLRYSVVHEFGAYHLRCALSHTFATLSHAVAPMLAVFPQVRRFPPPLPAAATASIAGLLLGSKILSPQFLIWLLVPASVFAASSWRRAALVLLVIGATSATYVWLTPSPLVLGSGVALTALRNVLLGVLLAVAARVRDPRAGILR